MLNDIRKATAGPDGGGIPIYLDPNGLMEQDCTMESTVVVDLEGAPLRTTLLMATQQQLLALIHAV